MADRAEQARFLRRLADLWERGEEESFEWSDRLERIMPNVREERQYPFRRYDPHAEGYQPPPRHVEVEWTHEHQVHPFTEMLTRIERWVHRSRSLWHYERRKAEAEQRKYRLLRDRMMVGLSAAECAKRYGTTPSVGGKMVKAMMNQCPTGPRGERWLAERGITRFAKDRQHGSWEPKVDLAARSLKDRVAQRDLL